MSGREEQPLGGLWEPGGSARRLPFMDMTTMLFLMLIAATVIATMALQSNRHGDGEA